MREGARKRDRERAGVREGELGRVGGGTGCWFTVGYADQPTIEETRLGGGCRVWR